MRSNIYIIYYLPGHEDRQKYLKALRNRQDLFQEEGILSIILDAIDKMNIISSQGLLSALAGEETGQQWNEVSGYLFQLLGKFLIIFFMQKLFPLSNTYQPQ